MSCVLVRSFGVSLDGFAAGPDQSLEHPLGVRGVELMDWFFPTRVWQRMQGQGDGETGVDNRIAELGFAEVGAWIASGELKYSETVVEGGVRQAPAAFLGMLRGENTGKMLVQFLF